MARILIVDDEEILARSVARFLNHRGHSCYAAHSAESALELIPETDPELLLLDIRLPGVSGLDLLAQIRQQDSQTPIIMMTAFASVEDAISAVRHGASNFVRKPIDLDELALIIDRALENPDLRRRVTTYQRQAQIQDLSDLFVAASEPMQRALEVVQRLSSLPASSPNELPTVLITGETGSGKDVFARLIHRGSPIHDRPFVEVNCTTLPRELAEAELFGHERGAYTDAKEARSGLFEAADRGTIFLDEIGDLALEIQTKLLTVIEKRITRRIGSTRDKKLAVRIIAATNRNLEELIRQGRFRQDLFFRLSVVTLDLPPLRERGEDLFLLADQFLEFFSRRYSAERHHLSAEARRAIAQYPWPGNVRELRHVLERATLLASGPEITPELLGLRPAAAPAAPPPPGPAAVEAAAPGPDGSQPIRVQIPAEGLSIDAVEGALLRTALTQASGNVSRAARLLGLSREAMRYRLAKHGIRE